jgi:thiosulfate/3-mercaptopyruvate sulfurtransferase
MMRIFYNKLRKMKMFKNNLVDTKMLQEYLKDGNIKHSLRVLDCTYYLPGDKRNIKTEFASERIPGSILFDIDEIKDKKNNLPHMLLTNEQEFISHMKRLDIRKKDTIICYDRHGIFSSPRVWFNLTIYGAEDVFILDGGYPKWKKDKLPVEEGIEKEEFIRPFDSNSKVDEFDYKLDTSNVVTLTQLLEEKVDREIIDARPPERYKGEVDEPRPVKLKGHIKNAKNVWYKQLMDENGCFKDKNEIKKVFMANNVNLKAQEFNVYCGSGMTACVDLFALSQLGKFDKCKLYDGSWAEAVR